MMKKFLCVFLSLCVVLFSFAAGAETVETKTMQYEFEDMDAWFLGDNRQYNADMGMVSLVLSAEIFDRAALESEMTDLGFSDLFGEYFDKDVSDTSATTAFLMGKKTLGDKTLVAVIVRGTAGAGEWMSNFDFAPDEMHEEQYAHAFKGSADEIMKVLSDYSDEKNTVYWVMGHSRGAAVANLVSAMLCDRETAGVFGYTFATPTVCRNIPQDEKYDCIFNILNGEDFVTYLPLTQWGYGRYGRDLHLPAYSSLDAQTRFKIKYDYYTRTGKRYINFADGSAPTMKLAEDMFAAAATPYEAYTKNIGAEDEPMTLAGYFFSLVDVITRMGSMDMNEIFGDMSAYMDADSLKNATTREYLLLLLEMMKRFSRSDMAGVVGDMAKTLSNAQLQPITLYLLTHALTQELLYAHGQDTYYSYMSNIDMTALSE